ncbi:hypothetical protein [Nevskia sp.]|uniref:hypothetical protein n=1 Tax=Nevskia sp. TaxID=1929292 RepID=UPI0025E59609|nr:hypothetical protein [Nevskia sp.]
MNRISQRDSGLSMLFGDRKSFETFQQQSMLPGKLLVMRHRDVVDTPRQHCAAASGVKCDLRHIQCRVIYALSLAGE